MVLQGFGRSNPFYMRLASAVSWCFFIVELVTSNATRPYGRVAMAYVQAARLKAIAPFHIERFETPGRQVHLGGCFFVLEKTA